MSGEELKGKNLFKYNGIIYTDNIPKNMFISITKEQYIEYMQQKEKIKQQQKEIEYLGNEKERIGKLQYDASETCFKNKEIILKQQKEIEELKKGIEGREARIQEELNENCKLKTELYGNSISKDKIRELIKEKAKTDTYNFKTVAVKDIEELLGE